LLNKNELKREGQQMVVLLRTSVGQSLRTARTSQGRTLRDVARDARVSLGYLSEVERGQKEASSELLNAICTALGLTLSSVISDVSRDISSREAIKLTVVDAA
jgi:transcriptional regulator with XRE-family HTH domain